MIYLGVYVLGFYFFLGKDIYFLLVVCIDCYSDNNLILIGLIDVIVKVIYFSIGKVSWFLKLIF